MRPLTTITMRLADDGKHPQADQRQAEEAEADALDEGRERRVRDIAPVEMARVAEELEFVAVEAIAAVGGDMHDCGCDGDGDYGKETRVRGRSRTALGISVWGLRTHEVLPRSSPPFSLRSRLGSGSGFFAHGLGDEHRLHAAAVAAWMPSSVSSNTRQCCGGNAQLRCGQQKSVGCGLAVLVVFGADEDVEFVEQTEGGERADD